MIDGPRRYWECCSHCGMQKLPPFSRQDRTWLDDHEEIACPKGTIVFCFREGDPADTFWEFLRRVTDGLGAKSCTSSAIENQRAPEWIRQCALEEMMRERNSRTRERFETIASFCKRRADELAHDLCGSTLAISAVFDAAAVIPRPSTAHARGGGWEAPAWLREWEAFYHGLNNGPGKRRTSELRSAGDGSPDPVLDGEPGSDATLPLQAFGILFELVARQAELLAEVAHSPCGCTHPSERAASGQPGCPGECLPERARRLLAVHAVWLAAANEQGHFEQLCAPPGSNQGQPEG